MDVCISLWQVAGKEVGGGWDPTYTRRSYFPYWRSVLRARCPMVVYPAYARQDPRSGLEQFHVSRSSPKVSGSTPTANHKLGLVGRLSSPVASNQPKRNFSIAAIGAFRLLKMLKHAWVGRYSVSSFPVCPKFVYLNSTYAPYVFVLAGVRWQVCGSMHRRVFWWSMNCLNKTGNTWCSGYL